MRPEAAQEKRHGNNHGPRLHQKVFSFGKDKAETEERPQEDAALERGNENASFEAALNDAEAHDAVDRDPVSELEMETAGGPAPTRRKI